MILIKDILSVVTEKDIMCFYWGESLVENQHIYRNPMRDDRNGRCYFRWDKRGSYKFYDKSLGMNYSFNCFDYVMFIYGCSLYEALYRINDDMILNARTKLLASSKIIHHQNVKEKRPINYQVKTRHWNDDDKKYWSQFGISIKTLDKIAKPVESYSSDNGGFTFTKMYDYQDDGELCYVYQFDKRIKLYRPNSIKNKWKSNITNKDIFGLKHLPHFGDTLFISSGAKDMLCLWEMGFNSIAPQSEMIDIPEEIMTDLKSRFKRIIYLFDNDETGIKMSMQFAAKNEVDYIILPKIDGDSNIKDVAELIKQTSIINTKSIIINECSKRWCGRNESSQTSNEPRRIQ